MPRRRQDSLSGETRTLDKRSIAERLNFLVTNRLPRRWLTLFMGRFSRIENPIVRDLSIGFWKLFVDDLRLFEAKKTSFRSLHDCFVRELRDDARPVDPDPAIVTSPCDAVIGEFGTVVEGQVLQAKGFPYSIAELLGNERTAAALEGARFVTLRLKSSMYHHFHAPCDARLVDLTYISGDTWNVNPAALKTLERLYCRNERAVLNLVSAHGERLTMVAVAAILVASMRFKGLDVRLDLRYDGPKRIRVDRELTKGDEIGWFEHGSTLILFLPAGHEPCAGITRGLTIRMGRPLFVRTKDAEPGRARNIVDTPA